MSNTASALVQKVWNYAHVMRDDGLSFMDYTEQITFLLFLKMAHERESLGLGGVIPKKYNWATLKREPGDAMEIQYSKTLRELGKLPGLLRVIFAKAQNKITDPAKLERLISMIDSENWAGLDMDVKGEIYEGLLARNAEDVRGCAMNLYLHGLGGTDKTIVETGDSLAKKGSPVDMVLTNPPFGKKSSITVVTEEGKKQTEKVYYERQDFWATTSNKQLNFVQNVYSLLKDTGRAAVVVPDNVLFEAGAGEKIRRNLLERCDVHTLLRLPTGIWYSPGVKANVLLFDKKPASKVPQTKELWVYDLRTNQNFTLRQNPIDDPDVKDFVDSCRPTNRQKRKESERFKRFTYADLIARDKANLDIFWLKDDSLEDSANLPDPDVIASQIVDDLAAALAEFSAIAPGLSARNGD